MEDRNESPESAQQGTRAIQRADSDEHPAHLITNPEIAKKATQAWLSTFFASPAGHRTNAQAGYTIAAAVAAAIVGAGLLTSADQAPLWVQIPLLVSLALWLWAAWKFMRTVAYQPNLGGVKHEADEIMLASQALQRTWREREKIASRSWAAQRVARAAGITTFIALTLLLLRPTLAKVDATVALTPDGSKRVGALCGSTQDTLHTRVDPAALDDSVVVLKDVSCNGEHRILRLPKADIAGTETR